MLLLQLLLMLPRQSSWEVEWVGRNGVGWGRGRETKKGLVGRVGPRAFPRFREPYRRRDAPPMGQPYPLDVSFLSHRRSTWLRTTPPRRHPRVMAPLDFFQNVNVCIPIRHHLTGFLLVLLFDLPTNQTREFLNI